MVKRDLILLGAQISKFIILHRPREITASERMCPQPIMWKLMAASIHLGGITHIKAILEVE